MVLDSIASPEVQSSIASVVIQFMLKVSRFEFIDWLPSYTYAYG